MGARFRAHAVVALRLRSAILLLRACGVAGSASHWLGRPFGLAACGRLLRLLQRHLFGVAAGLDLDLLAVLAGLGGKLALAFDRRGLGLRLQLLQPVRHGSFIGRALQGCLGRLFEALRSGGFLRCFCHGGNMENPAGKGKGVAGNSGTKTQRLGAILVRMAGRASGHCKRRACC